MELENVHVDCVEPRRKMEAQRLDLENAVLVQELMAVKEEKVSLVYNFVFSYASFKITYDLFLLCKFYTMLST